MKMPLMTLDVISLAGTLKINSKRRKKIFKLWAKVSAAKVWNLLENQN